MERLNGGTARAETPAGIRSFLQAVPAVQSLFNRASSRHPRVFAF
jgi:hypothetical protein